MTVAAIDPTISYVENGVTLAFAAPFRFLSSSDLVVSRIVGGVETVLAMGADWSATGGADDSGGTVTLLASVAGATLVITRETPRSQQTDYDIGGRFPAATHERGLDQAMLIDQEQDQLLSRALLVLRGEQPPRFASLLDSDGMVLGIVDGVITPVPNDSALAEVLIAIVSDMQAALPSKADARATVTASEAIAAGEFVNVYNSGGNIRVRKALASDVARFANGFAPAAIANGVSGPITFVGLNAAVAVAANASEAWLSDAVAGAAVTAPPSAPGSIIQSLGPAIAGLGIFFTFRERVLL